MLLIVLDLNFEMSYLILFSIPIVFLLSFLLFIFRFRLNHRSTINIIYIHFIALSLFLIDIILFLNSFNFYGYWTDRIIYLIYFLSAIILFFLGQKELINRIFKIHLFLNTFWPLILFIVGFIPRLEFLSRVLLLSLIGMLIGECDPVIYTNGDYSIQKKISGALGSPNLEIVERNFIFERPYSDIGTIFAINLDKINKFHIQPINNDSLRLIIYHNIDRFRLKNPLDTIITRKE